MRDVLTSGRKVVVGYSLAAMLGTAFVISVGLGYGAIVFQGLVIAGLLWGATCLKGWMMEYTPVGRIAASVGVQCFYWAAVLIGLGSGTTLLVLAGMPEQAAQSIQVAVIIMLPAWLFESLFQSGWQLRLSSRVQLLVADAKASAVRATASSYEYEVRSTRLSRPQRKGAARRIVLFVFIPGVAIYLVNATAYSLGISVGNATEFVAALSTTISAVLLDAWFVCLVYRMFDIAWYRGGVEVIEPWEESLMNYGRLPGS